jgi:NADH-quinone oxidoreductase subunit L
MHWTTHYLGLIPFLPLLAAGILALTPRPYQRLASSLAILSMVGAFFLSCAAFFSTLQPHVGGEVWREVYNFRWLDLGVFNLTLGWVLDPLTAIMLLMVTFVGTLIFIYSVGYMSHDPNFTRFFCFLSLFAGAMLGLIISNSLLLFFACWELVGLASYLLIGFWFEKPSAAAAAKKAFITTRLGDVGFFLGLVWLYSAGGTLVFYDQGNGCLERAGLAQLASTPGAFGLAAATIIGLLIFCGAAGKSGQVPLHVWLPDAMEGPTPVSALIHAATMVAAGVFLVARMYPLMALPDPAVSGSSPALAVVTWVGAITAIFAALIAVAQRDIKRILAYSTVSQLGYMMVGIGVGGVAVGMFHLITHAFFKALLFLGAGSVIHGMDGEQDIRQMGGLRKYMPVTFATYAIGMLALAGLVPLAGFWSKDEILHAAHGWSRTTIPFYLALAGAVLTAFYMTRQVCLVFFGEPQQHGKHAHESSPVMTVPLIILAGCAILIGFVGTPAWPWFQSYLTGEKLIVHTSALFHGEFLKMAVVSTLVVLSGIGVGWMLYGRHALRVSQPDPLTTFNPVVFNSLENRFFVDELYDLSVVSGHRKTSQLLLWLDRVFWEGLINLLSLVVLGIGWINRFLDEFGLNGGFDQACKRLGMGGKGLTKWQNGQIQNYICALAVGLTLLFLFLTWGGGKP